MGLVPQTTFGLVTRSVQPTGEAQLPTPAQGKLILINTPSTS